MKNDLYFDEINIGSIDGRSIINFGEIGSFTIPQNFSSGEFITIHANISNDQEFWETINDWPQDQPPSYEFCGRIDNHEKIYEEMKRFDGWTHSFSDDFDEELITNIACLSGSTRDRWAAVQEKWKIYGSDAAPHGDWQYYWAVPHKEDFPTIHEFMEKNPQYKHPVIAKLGPNEILLSPSFISVDCSTLIIFIGTSLDWMPTCNISSINFFADPSMIGTS